MHRKRKLRYLALRPDRPCDAASKDGLVHISQLADRYARDPAEVLKVHQKVTVTVLDAI